ncbi:hypothetical protein [Inquilinus sp. Marseille-Q2685]|uniref:hypothetical protein n=1 Tax=Inquilinus sp. Marseille-Q2685 TaxID=2866581 RepID=UPI001CE48FC8|nr:hypothetical protein [Inquilinus sp. Marseille-Q2685]
MLKPIERTPRPANPVRPNTDPEFQAAVRRALAARATAEGRPPESHGYETAGQVRPGDDLIRLVGTDGVANNRQFPDPGRIQPGDIYFQPGASPVSAQTEAVIDTALAYDREHGTNAPDSQRNWDAVESAIAGELRQTVQLDANGQLKLTDDQQQKLQALNSWAVGTDQLSIETQQALAKVDSEVQQTSRTTMLDQSIAAIQGDLDKVNAKLDDQSFVRKGWGWITPGKSSGEEFRDFLQGKLDDLKEIKADDTGLPQDQYQQKVTAVLGNFDQEFQDHAKAMEDSDKTWNTIGEVGRVVAATTVGIVTTAATGGNVVAGFAAGFGTYELIDAAGDISAVAQGKDMYADGHSSIIGFGMDAAGLDGDKGDGWGVSWDHSKAMLKDTAIDAVSSISTAGATTAGMKVSAAVGTRLASTALPNLGARVVATSAGSTVGQVVNGTGQLASDATRLAFDNKLFTAEGGRQMLTSAKTQGIYLATAPVTGAVSGAIPIQRVVGSASTGATQATQQATTQATQQGTSQTVQQATTQATQQGTSQTVQQATTQATQQGTSQTVQQATTQATQQGTSQTVQQATTQGTGQAAQQGASQTASVSAGAGDVTRLSRLGVTAQFGNDVASNLGGAELVAQLTEGRHMNRDEAISSVMGALPGTAQNVAMHPQMMQRIADRRDMLQANGGMRQEADVPKLWGWQSKIPEFRLGAQFRILGNPDMVTQSNLPQFGRPTLASGGAAISTKMNVRALGQSVIDSLVMGSTKPFRLTLGRELTVSQRPHEYRNITLKEAGMLPASNQTVFQIKGSTVLKQGEQALFATDPTQVRADFMPTLQGVRDVGAPRDADGNELPGSVMELSWGAMLPDAQTVTLHPGEMDLLGTVAGRDAPVDAFVAVPEGGITFTKLMEEQKVGIRPRFWTNFIPGLKHLPLLGAERRPEDNIKVTIPEGTVLSRQAWDQMQATYERLSMRTRIVVDDETSRLLLDSEPDLATIRGLVGDERIDPSTAVSYVPGRSSGMRLSAVTGKYAEEYVDLLTGRDYQWHRDAANADFIFNDLYPTESIPLLPDSVGNPDRALSNEAYQNRISAAEYDRLQGDAETRPLPRSTEQDRTPLVRGVPSEVNMYRRLTGPMASFVAEATRFTLSLKLPTFSLPFLPVAASLEFRGQVKIDPPGVSKETPRGVSRAVREREDVLYTYAGGDGGNRHLTVPSWLDAFLKHGEQGQGVLFPEGGAAAMRQYLVDLEASARTDQQRQAIADFRDGVLPKLGNEILTPPDRIEAIRQFLEGQAVPAGAAPRIPEWVPADPMPLWNQSRRSGGNP